MKALDIELAFLARHFQADFNRRLKVSEFGPNPWILPLPRVLVMEAKRSKSILGWYAPKRWGQGAINLDELVLTPDAVSHGVLQAAAVMAHEFVHLANAVAKRPDTSRQGRYHNRAFRETAELLGLSIAKDPVEQFGWCDTKLGNELAEGVRELIRAKQLNVHPFRFHRRSAPKQRQALVKLVVECCDDFVYVTAARASTIQICCGECGARYMIDTSKPAKTS